MKSIGYYIYVVALLCHAAAVSSSAQGSKQRKPLKQVWVLSIKKMLYKCGFVVVNSGISVIQTFGYPNPQISGVDQRGSEVGL